MHIAIDSTAVEFGSLYEEFVMTRKRKVSSSAIILLAFIIVFSSVFISVCCLNNLNVSDVAVAATDIGELWDSTNEGFNKNAVDVRLLIFQVKPAENIKLHLAELFGCLLL